MMAPCIASKGMLHLAHTISYRINSALVPNAQMRKNQPQTPCGSFRT
jgi:hypothetical protein